MYLVFYSRFLVSGPETLLSNNLEKVHTYYDIYDFVRILVVINLQCL